MYIHFQKTESKDFSKYIKEEILNWHFPLIDLFGLSTYFMS